eukprot:1141324-Pelagomonas_calceolata.AAC.1
MFMSVVVRGHTRVVRMREQGSTSLHSRKKRKTTEETLPTSIKEKETHWLRRAVSPLHHGTFLLQLSCPPQAAPDQPGISAVCFLGEFLCLHSSSFFFPFKSLKKALFSSQVILCGDFNAHFGELSKVSDAHFRFVLDCPELLETRRCACKS